MLRKTMIAFAGDEPRSACSRSTLRRRAADLAAAASTVAVASTVVAAFMAALSAPWEAGGGFRSAAIGWWLARRWPAWRRLARRLLPARLGLSVCCGSDRLRARHGAYDYYDSYYNNPYYAGYGYDDGYGYGYGDGGCYVVRRRGVDTVWPAGPARCRFATEPSAEAWPIHWIAMLMSLESSRGPGVLLAGAARVGTPLASCCDSSLCVNASRKKDRLQLEPASEDIGDVDHS